MSLSLPLNSEYSLKKELLCMEHTYFFTPTPREKKFHLEI